MDPGLAIEPLDSGGLARLRGLAAQPRSDSIRCRTAAGPGNPASAMSAAGLMAVLPARHPRHHPEFRTHDHLIFSRGHASPLLYAMFAAAGVISDEELVEGFRGIGTRLLGHPTPVLPWLDRATGSLGQGVPYGLGIALAGRHLDRLSYRTWALCGDSEMAEGSICEALGKTALYRLGNLTAIIDVNRLGQRGPTEFGWDLAAYRRPAEASGARVFEVEGHDVAAIGAAFTAACACERPTVVLAKTVTGAGFSETADQEGRHGRPLPPEATDRAIAELGGRRRPRPHVHGPAPDPVPASAPRKPEPPARPTYRLGEQVATRKAYGQALAALGAAYDDVVALDGEVGSSTYPREFAKAHSEDVMEAVADQNQTPGIAHLPVRDPPGSGRPQELQDAAGITAPHIVTTAHALLN